MTRAALRLVDQAGPDEASFARSLDEWTVLLQFERRSPLTLDSYMRTLRRFADSQRAAGRSVDPVEMTRTDVRRFMTEIQSAGFAPSTQQQTFGCLRSYFRFLVREGIRDVNPIREDPFPKVKMQRTEIMTDADVESLLAATSGRDFLDRRDHAIIRLFLSTGIRRNELLDLLVEDVDVKARLVTIHGKGENVRVVPFGHGTALALTRYLREREGHRAATLTTRVGRVDTGRIGRPMWLGHGRKPMLREQGLWVMLERRRLEAKLDGIHPHMFRHTWAHQLKLRKVNIDEMLYLGGWTNPRQLLRYGISGLDERVRAGFVDHMDRIAVG